MENVQDAIHGALKTAMKAGEKQRVGAIRLITAAIKQFEVDNRSTPDDNQVIAMLDKMAKQRRESISQFEQAGRDDLVATEAFELEVIAEFLPTPLSDDEIDTIIAQAIAETGASSMQDMGKVMGLIKPKLAGRADMGQVSGRIKASLNLQLNP